MSETTVCRDCGGSETSAAMFRARHIGAPGCVATLRAENEAYKAREAIGNEERGYCAKCMTTIWGREGHFIENDGKKYHDVCKVALRAEVAEAQNESLTQYLKFIGDELEETAAFAHAHGWRSSRYEQGVEMRKKLGIPERTPQNPKA